MTRKTIAYVAGAVAAVVMLLIVSAWIRSEFNLAKAEATTAAQKDYQDQLSKQIAGLAENQKQIAAMVAQVQQEEKATIGCDRREIQAGPESAGCREIGRKHHGLQATDHVHDTTGNARKSASGAGGADLRGKHTASEGIRPGMRRVQGEIGEREQTDRAGSEGGTKFPKPVGSERSHDRFERQRDREMARRSGRRIEMAAVQARIESDRMRVGGRHGRRSCGGKGSVRAKRRRGDRSGGRRGGV